MDPALVLICLCGLMVEITIVLFIVMYRNKHLRGFKEKNLLKDKITFHEKYEKLLSKTVENQRLIISKYKDM